MKICIQLFATLFIIAAISFLGVPAHAQGVIEPCVPQYTNNIITNNYFSDVFVQNDYTYDVGASPGLQAYYNSYASGFDITAYQGSIFKVYFKTDNNSKENVAAWVDFDGDGTFSASEKAIELDGLNPGTADSFNINIPADAPVGVHIFRLRLVNGTLSNNMSPCDNYTSGQTDDITINICGNLSPYCEPLGELYMREADIYLKQIMVGSTVVNADSLGVAYDYVSTPTVLQAGGTYSIHTTFGGYSPKAADGFMAMAWIDYNNDNTFSNDELLGDTTRFAKPYQTNVISFTIPANISGLHRLRVSLADSIRGVANTLSSYLDPCPAHQIISGRDFLLSIPGSAGVSNVSALQQSMQISNNPGSNGYSQLTFNTQGNIKGNVVITDVTGRVLQSTPFTAANGQVTQTLQVAGISAGIYFVNVEQNGKAVGCKKWVVQ